MLRGDELPSGVPVAPMPSRPVLQSGRHESFKTVPVGKQDAEAAKAALARDGEQLPQGIPAVPVKATPQQKDREAVKQFHDAVSPGTPKVKDEFTKAAAPVPKDKKTDPERAERMRKAMKEWQRRRARDDFERER